MAKVPTVTKTGIDAASILEGGTCHDLLLVKEACAQTRMAQSVLQDGREKAIIAAA